MAKLGERMITIDCDVIGADGGTRTASITGAWVALSLALRKHFDPANAKTWPLTGQIAAVSVGIVDGTPVLDLPYVEDSTAEVDMNVAMTAAGRLRRIAGHGRGRDVRPRAARYAAGPRRRRHPAAVRSRSSHALAEPCLRRRCATSCRACRGLPHHRSRDAARAEDVRGRARGGRSGAGAAARRYLRAVRALFRRLRARCRRAADAASTASSTRSISVQYNLAAERGVAQKRVEAVRGVLGTLAELGTA